ncbi:MAG TPA: phosphotransferase [Acidimicrobiia bacterium]|nr:phosphotransferase [Acidimicrobiia bacterium]
MHRPGVERVHAPLRRLAQLSSRVHRAGRLGRPLPDGAQPCRPSRYRREVFAPDAVAAFLSDHFGSAVSNVERVGQGEWSTAYAFERSGEVYVVRFGSYGEDFEKDRLASRYGAPELPIPRILETGRAADGFFAISERARGIGLDELDEAQVKGMLPALLNGLDAIADADLSGTTGFGTWGPSGSSPRESWRDALLDVGDDPVGYRTHGWRERLAASTVGMRPFEIGFQRLVELVEGCPEERHLVHSDLLNNNVLVDGERLTAVLDWGSAKYGDPIYDGAWLSFWWPWYPAWQNIDIDHILEEHYAANHLEGVEERLRCYRLHIGLEGMAYQAFTQDWDQLASTTELTLAVAERDT